MSKCYASFGQVLCQFWLEIEWGRHGFVLGGVSPVRSSAARAALRGASPLPHLLQRGHAWGRGVASLGARFEASGAAAVPPQGSSQTNKGENHGLSGSARCNKCGSGLAPRSAARAALDLTGTRKTKAYPCIRRSNQPHCRQQPPAAPQAGRFRLAQRRPAPPAAPPPRTGCCPAPAPAAVAVAARATGRPR